MIKLTVNPVKKQIVAIVKFSGDCTIDTSGFVVDQNALERLRIAVNEYNAVSDTQYPVGATGVEISRIDEEIEVKSSAVRQAATLLAVSAKTLVP